ncbi:hypothetical protein [Amycolatopsis jejuensis]|uniref:hypothetical protein n=1 Tax=Amycolatopsis jejuensis TaxID=330084 RepID=UPI000A9429FE|nr:hypothetical protein [Amycolatopsis jejuensis]
MKLIFMIAPWGEAGFRRPLGLFVGVPDVLARWLVRRPGCRFVRAYLVPDERGREGVHSSE